jgi:hypothetical protein
MPGTRHQFAPTVTVKKPINRAVIDFVSDAFLKGVLDLGHSGNFSALSWREERSKELLLFLPREILMTTASLAWCFHGYKS